MKENEILREIMRDAKIGWWQADRNRRVFHISEGLRDLLGVCSCEVTYEEFGKMITPAYREYALASIGVRGGAERLYPLQGPEGEIWCYWKLLREEVADDGGMLLTGYFRVVDPPSEVVNSQEKQRINDLLFRLNSISQTLLSLLKVDDLDAVVNKILADVLTMFDGGRAYIIESDPEHRLYNCTYEVTAENVTGEQELVSGISMDEVPWWTQRIANGQPVIISSLDELPDEAFREREVLAMQDIKSLIAVPLLSRDKVWGYAGIDIVNRPRIWTGEDYQWFSSLINIISLCIELQRSEREAQSERKYLQSLYHHMPLGYAQLRVIRDRQGKPVDLLVLDTNYTADKIMGAKRETYIGRRISELGLDMEQYLKTFTEVLRSDGFIERDSFYEISKRWIHSILYTTRPDEVISLFSDTTEMRNAHEALFNSEKMLRNIFDNVQVGVELYDKEGYLVDINAKDLDIFGIAAKEDVLGINFFENPIVPEEIRRNVRNGQEQSFRLDYPFDRLGGYYPSRKKGSVQIYTKVTMLYDMYGELVNFLVLNIDNTEINEAHHRLEEFESSFSLVSRFGKVGYARFDLVTRDGYAVPQWYRNLGEESNTPMTQVIGVYNHVNPEDREAIFREIGRVKANESNGFTLDLRVGLRDGKSGWTRVNVVRNPLNTDPSKIEMVCVNFDVTELKQTEKSLIEAKNKAEVSDRLKSAFLANMSHEIRTPLNAIVGFSNLLAETDDIAERREYMQVVEENNDLLLKLISDILDLSKIEAGTFEFNYGMVDVNRMCEEAVRALSLKVQDKPVELLFGDHEAQCCIVGDKNRLLQVITNFINNAVKFTEQGSITLGYRREAGDLLFYVEDTGKGISEEHLRTVFDRFVKLNSFAQGTGLGLSISKSIVEQMGGHIGVESEEGRGSRFWFTIPAVACNAGPDDEPSVVAEAPHPVSCQDGKLPLLLVAEDTDSNFLLVSLMFRKEFDIVRAVNGEEAVRICREMNPAAILMDIKMPVMDGFEAMRRIRAFDPAVPIVAVTAFAYDRDRQKAFAAGANGYVAKPLSGEHIRRVLGTLLAEI
ncbi:ATP-binding protein [Alistipes onderdonkii]|uniref:ATP-binding protein n=1 Tax=Alistipes onderdonkii TaxID=328813 RepID=UPI0034A3FAE8